MNNSSSSRGILRTLIPVALVGIAGLFQGCALAPGMRYGGVAPSDGSVDTSGTINGVKIELRSLNTGNLLEARAKLSEPLPAPLVDYKPGPYRLGKHDVVMVAVWEHPELSLPLGQYRTDIASGMTVDDSGAFFYPYAGLVRAEGLTTGELRTKLVDGVSKALNFPQLDVRIMAFRSKKVFVMGGVQRPGSIPITDVPLSLMDAVLQAGGIANVAGGTTGDPTRVELVRDGQVHAIDLQRTYADNRNASQILLKDGDLVRVPTSEESSVYVLGEVGRPAAVPMVAGRVNLIHALAEVGGISPISAQSKGIYVIRPGDDRIKVWHLNARDPLALSFADRFPLQPRDIVFVDATNLAMWNRFVNLVLPTAQLYMNVAEASLATKNLTR